MMCVLIFVLNLDTVLVKVNPFTTSQSLSNWRIIIFAVIVIVMLFGQYFMIRMVKDKNNVIVHQKVVNLDTISKMILIVQCGLNTILFIIILQMLVMSRYDVLMLELAAGISYALAAATLGLLAKRFIIWYKSDRNLIVGLYGLAASVLSASVLFSLLFVITILSGLPTYVYPHIGFNSPAPFPDLVTEFLNHSYYTLNILSFILLWAATAVLLEHYSRKLGKIRYWIIVTIPLVYFLVQFMPFFESLYFTFSRTAPILLNIMYTLFVALSKPVGGILFGIAFWTVARGLANDSAIRNYMIISGYGFVLLFASDQAIVLSSAPYPPFGLPTVLFIGLSSYLILVGIYSSAVSMAHDVRLRQSIRKFALKESRLLDGIGTAHVQEEIQKRAVDMTRQFQKNMREETGFRSTLEEEDVREYIDQVLEEIGRTKDKSSV